MKNESYGLKEVADVLLIDLGVDSTNTTLYQIDEKIKAGVSIAYPGNVADYGDILKYTFIFGSSGAPATIDSTNMTNTTGILLFDSLKITNLEMSSEDTSARGGKGNPELIVWSYGKSLAFNMTDALFNNNTLDLLFGKEDDTEHQVSGSEVSYITANAFNHYYTIIGMTVRRSYTSGKDEPYIFIMPKVYVGVNGTLTMEAEGDPSTFEFQCRALTADLNGKKDVLVSFFSQKTPAGQ